jgi:hypothetical protein
MDAPVRISGASGRLGTRKYSPWLRAFLAKIIWYNLRNNLTSDYFSQGVPTIKIIQIISKIICHINKNKLSIEIIEPHKSCASGTIDYPTFYHHYP